MTIVDSITGVALQGGVLLAFAAAAFKLWGEKWLEKKFTTNLEALRHQHARQMESVRLEASRALDRATRINEREFDATAEAWSHTYDAFVHSMGAMPGMRSQPNFSKLPDEVVSKILLDTDFDEMEVTEMLSLPKSQRDRFYGDRARLHEIAKAKHTIGIAQGILERNIVYLETDIYSELIGFINWSWRAVITREIIVDLGPGDFEGIERVDDDFRKSAEGRIHDLGLLVRERLWLHAVQNPRAQLPA